MSTRQQDLERLYNQRKGHVPQISITDDSQHMTEAIGSYYEVDDFSLGAQPSASLRDNRPLSFVPGEKERYDTRSRRLGTYMESAPSAVLAVADSSPSASAAHGSSHHQANSQTQPPARLPPIRTRSNEQTAQIAGKHGDERRDDGRSKSPKTSVPNVSRRNDPSPSGSESSLGQTSRSTPQPPPLGRQTSSETAVQQFPLNDIDYESSPAAVAQELSNLQAIRRMSMNVDTADPDLPSFAGASQSDDDSDPSKLFWVPARLHPELAPKEFKNFLEDRVDMIRRRSGTEDSLLAEGLERSGSDSSLRRKKSMLSHQINTREHYQDGAERLSRKRSRGMRFEGQTLISNLSDLETLVNDPAQLIQRISLDTSRRSQDSGIDVQNGDDMPILPGGGMLKRSTRTTYRRGSVKKGERIFPKRGRHHRAGSDADENPPSLPDLLPNGDFEPTPGISRAMTDPTHHIADSAENFSRPTSRRQNLIQSPAVEEPAAEKGWQNQDDLIPEVQKEEAESIASATLVTAQPQQRQFQSRIASIGRTTAQLPGYNNTNPLPNVVETLADGSKVPAPNLLQKIPERKSSHELPQKFQRSGPPPRSASTRQPTTTSTSTLDDLSQSPSPLPGSGDTRTDALTIVPTFEEKKVEKKETPKKSGWKWFSSNDDDDKEKKVKEEKAESKTKSGKLSKVTADKARLDVLQNSIDGTVPARGRESIVLNREDIKIEDDRKPSKKSESKKEGQPGLLSALFGGKKKTSDSDLKEKKRKGHDRNHSPEHIARYLKPDIDYNWTRFSILEERAIYRMAHLKLANPRRALHSQVLLSNFMYSYLAKVQMMHPQIQIPPAQRAAQQRNQPKQEEPQQQQSQPSQQPQSQQQRSAEYGHYQRWQEQQARNEADSEQNGAADHKNNAAGRGSSDHQLDDYDDEDQRRSADYDRRSSEDHNRSREQYQPSSSQQNQDLSSSRARERGTRQDGADGGYSVASTHDYLGYRHDEKPFDESLWDEDDKPEELW